MIATEPTTKTTWAIDNSHTLAEFSVKHLMVSTTKGRFTSVTGSITLDEADIRKSNVDVTIDTASLSTFDDGRDAHLRSADFFDVENFPALTFKSTRVEPDGKDRLKVTGDLTIRDVTASVVLDVEFNGQQKSPWGSEVIGYTAHTQINRKDFGLTWNAALETGGVVVGDKVKIALEVEATKQ